MTEDEKYDIAVKLIGNGYLIHCTNAVFNEFDKSYIQGGSRAHEGYGFYFTKTVSRKPTALVVG